MLLIIKILILTKLRWSSETYKATVLKVNLRLNLSKNLKNDTVVCHSCRVNNYPASHIFNTRYLVPSHD